ncbi:Uncharacterized protein FWK35_00028389 [Aphis craccivora]|uniref:Uncharacterized protein n=1 Tax=Aphis craccivora TaxID=307492 RepID=A0A6G0Y3W7_APHCR|nr:Uncharacterized protein FWK35_00028389 [Aphis craccivora]
MLFSFINAKDLQTDIKSVYIAQRIIIKVAYSLPPTYPSIDIFKNTNILSIYKLYIKQTLIKTIQMQILNNTDIIDSRTGYNIKLPYISLSSTKKAPDYMVKTIFNNLGNNLKSLIKYECENQSNKTNEKNMMNKNRIKNVITKIVNDLDENVCKNNLLKSIYV